MRSAPLTLALAATAAAPAIASAQLIQPIAQTRSVSASSTTSYIPTGETNTDTPPPDEAFPGDYLPLFLRVDTQSMTFGDDGFNNNMSGYSEQDGGWNGDDAITLWGMSLNAGGGGPPGYSVAATVDNTFSYTFTTSQTLDYSLTGTFGGCPFPVSLTLSEGANTIESISSTCEITPTFDESGTLQAGQYTLEFLAGGSVAFENGGGGGGAGGGGLDSDGNPTPVFNFLVTPHTCASDLTGDSMVDVFDLLAYLDQWFSADAAADIDGTPGVDVFDLLAYLDGWFAGC